jgi:hypothetical protein
MVTQMVQALPGTLPLDISTILKAKSKGGRIPELEATSRVETLRYTVHPIYCNYYFSTCNYSLHSFPLILEFLYNTIHISITKMKVGNRNHSFSIKKLKAG